MAKGIDEETLVMVALDKPTAITYLKEVLRPILMREEQLVIRYTSLKPKKGQVPVN